MNSPVTIQELSCHSDFNIGYIQLNSPKTLNALSLEMITCIYSKLLSWQNDQNIVAVFIEGAGDKAFCAGGDVVSLYHDLAYDSPDEQNTNSAQNYFTQEYQLDFLIQQYKKPIITWGNGIVMGGGVGLMVGASHRIVTENTKLAMPEVTIGLFPDVCGSYFLNKMPNNLGLFVGLTGAMLNAEDAIYSGLANYKVLQPTNLHLK